MKQNPTITEKDRKLILKAAAIIKKYTSATERRMIAVKHEVKTRAQVSNILNAKSLNQPLLNAMLLQAERNKEASDDATRDFEARVTALGV